MPLVGGIWVSLVPVGIPVMLGLGKDVLTSIVILNMSEVQCSHLCPNSWESSFLCDPVILSLLEGPGVGTPLGVVELCVEQCPRSAKGTGTDWKEPMPLAGQEFLHPWISEFPVTLDFEAVVASSPLIL